MPYNKDILLDKWTHLKLCELKLEKEYRTFSETLAFLLDFYDRHKDSEPDKILRQYGKLQWQRYEKLESKKRLMEEQEAEEKKKKANEGEW